MRILVTAGPTREAIDPVRFLSNRSSGKMGYALVQAALDVGAEVVLVSGPVALTPPSGLVEFVPVVSAADMADAVRARFGACDAAIFCAAVADYRPAHPAKSKIKKREGALVLELERTEDILASCGMRKREDQILVGFAAETDDLEENAMRKLVRKNADWIVANDVAKTDRGFAGDDNAATLFARDGRRIELPLQSKTTLARAILQTVLSHS